ncbi:MAG: hypothetical protein ABI813_09010 [Bacteroidota bacterium]
MQASFDNIVQHLFHQPSLHSVTVEELENMARQHPYFAAAHFLLLKKMQDTAHPAFTDQLHKTALYFNNPLWLQFLLEPELVGHFTVSDKSPFIISEPAENPQPMLQENQPEYAVTTASENEPQTDPPSASAAADSNPGTSDFVEHLTVQAGSPERDSMMDIITSVFSDPDPLYNAYIAEPAHEKTAPDEKAALSPVEPRSKTDDNTDSLVPEAIAAENGIPINAETWPGEEEAVAAPMSETATLTDKEPAPEHVNPEQPEFETATIPAAEYQELVPVATLAQYEDTAPVCPAGNDEAFGIPDPITPQTVESLVEQIDIIQAKKAALQPEEVPETKSEEPGTISGLSAKTIIETPGAKDDLLFEPYHTVDYFASQGIKLSKTEADPKDKLGRQLKSFTDWLKTMKKLPQASIDKMLAEKEDSKVVEDANHSIENKEVITETMAEVFEKQGLYEKAVEIYQKLSLLNPSKSAYFAAKAEALKH